MKSLCKLSSVREAAGLLQPPFPPPKLEIIRLLKGLQEEGKAILVAQTACKKAGGDEEGSVWVGWALHRSHEPASAGGPEGPPNTPQNTSLICDSDFCQQMS